MFATDKDFYLLYKILVTSVVASFPILDTIYLAEIITEKKKKKKGILNCCQFWSQKAQRGKQFHVWRLAMRHFTSQGPSLREYWAKWSIPRRKRGLKTAIIYIIVSLEFSIRTDFQTVILSFLASSLPHPLLHFYGAPIVVALSIPPSPSSNFKRIFKVLAR